MENGKVTGVYEGQFRVCFLVVSRERRDGEKHALSVQVHDNQILALL